MNGNNVIHPRPDSSFNGQSGTFAPRMSKLKDSQGPACTISQMSNQIELNKEIGPSVSECDEVKPQQIVMSTAGQGQNEKASDTSNILTLNDLKVLSSSQKDSSRKTIENNLVDMDAERPTLLS